jgi:hypothetical protein
MKKFFAIAVIAVAMAACNNNGESTTGSDTANAVKPDTTVTTDTTHAVDTNKMKTDTTPTKK